MEAHLSVYEDIPSSSKKNQSLKKSFRLFRNQRISPAVQAFKVHEVDFSVIEEWPACEQKKSGKLEDTSGASIIGSLASSLFSKDAQQHPGSRHPILSWSKRSKTARVSSTEKIQPFPLASIKKLHVGADLTLSHRILFRANGWQDISSWHDIPMAGPDGTFHFVCTTPKDHWGRFEIAKDEPQTPLRLKKNAAKEPSHYLENAPLNYGFIPQTAFDKEVLRKGASPSSEETNPVFVFDLGSTSNRQTGDVYLVKPLAGFLVADNTNGFSWHIVAIDRDDPKADIVNDLKDIENEYPGGLRKLASWLKAHNIDNHGDKEALIGNNGKAADLKTVKRVIELSHHSWKTLNNNDKANRMPLCDLRPLSIDELEMVWQEQTSNESAEAISHKKPVIKPLPSFVRSASFRERVVFFQ